MKRNNMKLKRKNIRSKILVGLIVVIIVAIVVIYSGYKNKTNNIIDRAAKCVTVNDKKMDVNFKKLKKINKDIVAYIKFENVYIEFPVVRAENNEFYSNHNLHPNLI